MLNLELIRLETFVLLKPFTNEISLTNLEKKFSCHAFKLCGKKGQ